MKVLLTMALGGNQKGNLCKSVCDMTYNRIECNAINYDGNSQESEHLSLTLLKKQDEYAKTFKKNSSDICTSASDGQSKEFVDGSTIEKNLEDVNQSSDSLSSSASISDSDLTSTDSEDSLALSESESITDVTPLNSPYCDSPLPQSRHIEFKSEDKTMTNPSRNVDYDGSDDNCHRPEMNVLMKAIEKLELEAKNRSDCGFHENLMRRRATSVSGDESKRIEQENQRLFKRVISQQNRIRTIYSTSSQSGSKIYSCRHHDLVKSDGDISGAPKKSVVGKFPKDGEKSHVHRKQKCLSHPSSFIYSCNHLIDKSLKGDDLCLEKNRGENINSTGMKIPCPQKSEAEEVMSSSGKLK